MVPLSWRRVGLLGRGGDFRLLFDSLCTSCCPSGTSEGPSDHLVFLPPHFLHSESQSGDFSTPSPLFIRWLAS